MVHESNTNVYYGYYAELAEMYERRYTDPTLLPKNPKTVSEHDGDCLW